jgi:hypothetical protein
MLTGRAGQACRKPVAHRAQDVVKERAGGWASCHVEGGRLYFLEKLFLYARPPRK